MSPFLTGRREVGVCSFEYQAIEAEHGHVDCEVEEAVILRGADAGELAIRQDPDQPLEMLITTNEVMIQRWRGEALSCRDLT